MTVMPAVATAGQTSTVAANSVDTPRQQMGSAKSLPSLVETTVTQRVAAEVDPEMGRPKKALRSEERSSTTTAMSGVASEPCTGYPIWEPRNYPGGAQVTYQNRVREWRIWTARSDGASSLVAPGSDNDWGTWYDSGSCPPDPQPEPPAPTLHAVSPPGGMLVGTRTPTLRALARSNAGFYALSYAFTVCEDEALSKGCASAPTLGNDVNTWQVPAGKLVWSKQYWWRVIVTDTSNSKTAGWTGTFTTGVRQPVITSQLSTSSTGAAFETATGNYTTSVTDALVANAGLPLGVVRSYNSMDPHRGGMFGAGWSTAWDMRIVTENHPDGVTLLVTLANGKQVRFAASGDGTFQPPPGMHATLANVSDGGWRLMDKASTSYHFDGQGRLTKITDLRGRALTLTYSAAGTLEKVTGLGDRRLTFTWTGKHVTEVMTAPVNGTPLKWTYIYDGDKLTQVCSPQKAPNCTAYDYTTGSQYASTVLNSDPLSYWRLGETSKEEAKDAGWAGSSGRYNDVTLGQPGAIEGSTDTAIQLSRGVTGPQPSVTLPEHVIARIGTGASFETWFKTSQQGAIFSTSGTDEYFYSRSAIYVGSDGKLRGQFRPTDGSPITPITSASAVNDGQWHHVVLTMAGDKQTMYVDGTVAGTVTATPGWGGWPVTAQLGAGVLNDGNPLTTPAGAQSNIWPAIPATNYSGYLDEVAIFDKPLSAQEVALHYAARTAAPHLLTKIARPSGRVEMRAVYDTGNDRIKTYTDANGGTWQISAPVPGPVDLIDLSVVEKITVTDPASNTLVYEHDSWRGNRLISITDQLGKKTSYGYDTGGFLEKATDPNGNAVTRANDKRGNALAVSTCRSAGNCQTQRVEYSLNTNDEFDPRNDRPIKIRDARSATATDNTYATSIEYNSFGEQIKQTTPATPDFPNGRSTTVAYTDGTETAVGGGTTPAGLPKIMTDLRGHSWTYRYTAAGDLVEQTDPGGLITKLDYDAIGRPTSSTQVSSAFPDGVKTVFTYDAAGRPETLTEPGVKNEVSGVTHTKKTTRTYDADGNTLSEIVTDLTGGDVARSIVNTYDAQGRVETITGAEGGVVRQTWNTLGQLVRITDARGTVVENAYTKRGELHARTLKGWTGSPVNPQPAQDVVLESLAYDPAGRLATRTDAMGRKTSYTYFTDNLLWQKIADDVKLNGSATARDVTLEAHTYDAAGQRTKLVTGGGVATTETVYDAAGRITSQTFDPAQLVRKTAFTYDANGNILKTTHTGGGSTRAESTEYAYNKANLPTRETVENGEQDLISTLAYDERGLVTAITDPRGNVAGVTAADFTTRMRYDAMGRLAEAVGPQVAVDKAGSSTSAKPTVKIGYDTFGAETHKTDAEGRTLTSVFDKAGRLMSQVAPSYTPPGGLAMTPTTTYAYDAAGQLIKTTNPQGFSTTFDYDQLGHQVRINNLAPEGKQSAHTVVDYDLVGEKLAVIDPTGARSEQTYDDLGRVITSTQVERSPAPAAFTTRLEYNDGGRLIRQVAPGDRITSFAVNAAGEVITQTDPATNKTLMAYDLAGRLIRTTDPEGNATTAEYDLAGRQIGVQDLNASGAMVRSASTAYDAAGNPISATSPEGHVTKQTYDALNRVTSLIEPISASESTTTRFGYDATGARTRLTDGRGNATWTSYNSLGLAETVTEPATTAHPNPADRTWTSIYDQAGNPVTSLLPGGVRIDRHFDYLGFLTQESGSGGGAASAHRYFRYDLAGRTTRINNTDLSYNDRGLLTFVGVEQPPTGFTTYTAYTYDEAGNPIQRVDDAGTANFTWDKANRLATATDPLTGRTLTYGYDKASRLTSMTGKTNTGAASDSQTFTYDAVDRLESQTLKNGTGAQLAKITYGWDKDDNLTTKTTAGTAGAGINTYTYDHAGRLTSWTAPGGAKTDYAWDASGNRTKAGDKTYTYDERNRLTSGNGTTYAYTPRGTLATETKNGQTTNLTFDAFDRLIADGDSLYTYDGLDRVTSRTRGTTKQTFTYSGLGNDLAKISETSGDIQARYGRDPFGGLLGQQEGTGPVVATLTDLHGDLVATFSTTGLATSTAYDPFGTITAQTGAKTNLGYQGEYADPETGKTNMHARWYQPGTGTFTSRDTANLNPSPSVQANRYTYANASPLTGIDPTGHATETPNSWNSGGTSGWGNTGGGYWGDPCSAGVCLQPGGAGSGGPIACSGAGLDICGGFEPHAEWESVEYAPLFDEAEARRIGVMENGRKLPRGIGEDYWLASQAERDAFHRAWNPELSDKQLSRMWWFMRFGSTKPSGGGRAGPNPDDCTVSKTDPYCADYNAQKRCEQKLGKKHCNDLLEAARYRVVILVNGTIIAAPTKGQLDSIVNAAVQKLCGSDARCRRHASEDETAEQSWVIKEVCRVQASWCNNFSSIGVGGTLLVGGAGVVGLGKFSSGKPPHIMTVTVYNEKGVPQSSFTLRSGNATPEEIAKGFPRTSLLTHTENRAMRSTPVRPGWHIVMEGQYPPCPSCKGAMNERWRNERGRVSITYIWRSAGPGAPGGGYWSAGGGRGNKAVWNGFTYGGGGKCSRCK